MTLRAFYGSIGFLCAALYDDASESWQQVTVQSVGGMAQSPAAVVWNNDLHVFHQGGYANDLVNPAGFQKSAIGPDLGLYAVRSYSLMRPPRTGRRLIRSWERSATGWSGRGRRRWRLR